MENNFKSLKMITTKIQIDKHLAEYAIGKFSKNSSNPISIPSNYDLYHTIVDLLASRPENKFIDEGNLEIAIPDSRNAEIRKNPLKFNWLSKQSTKIIERKIEVMMFAELHDLMDEKKHFEGLFYADTVHIFMTKYSISSISEDAFLKNYYRYRRKIRRSKEVRHYIKKN